MAMYVDAKTGHVLSMSPQRTLRMDQVEANAGRLLLTELLETDLLHQQEVWAETPEEEKAALLDEVSETVSQMSQAIMDLAAQLDLHQGMELVPVKEWLESQEEHPATEEEAEALYLGEMAGTWQDLLSDLQPPEWD